MKGLVYPGVVGVYEHKAWGIRQYRLPYVIAIKKFKY